MLGYHRVKADWLFGLFDGEVRLPNSDFALQRKEEIKGNGNWNNQQTKH